MSDTSASTSTPRTIRLGQPSGGPIVYKRPPESPPTDQSDPPTEPVDVTPADELPAGAVVQAISHATSDPVVTDTVDFSDLARQFAGKTLTRRPSSMSAGPAANPTAAPAPDGRAASTVDVGDSTSTSTAADAEPTSAVDPAVLAPELHEHDQGAPQLGQPAAQSAAAANAPVRPSDDDLQSARALITELRARDLSDERILHITTRPGAFYGVNVVAAVRQILSGHDSTPAPATAPTMSDESAPAVAPDDSEPTPAQSGQTQETLMPRHSAPIDDPLFGDYSAGQLLEDEIPLLSVRRPTAAQPDESVTERSTETSNSDAIDDGSVSDETANSAAAAELSDTENTDATPTDSAPAAPATALPDQTLESTVNNDESESDDAEGACADETTHAPANSQSDTRRPRRAGRAKPKDAPATADLPERPALTRLPIDLLYIDETWDSVVMPPAPNDDRSYLKASIELKGITEPITVWPRGDRYIVVCGATRLSIARELGMPDLPVNIRAFASEAEAQAEAIQDNLSRRHLTTSQKGLLAARLQKLMSVGQGRRTDREPSVKSSKVDSRKQAAQTLGIGESTVAAGTIVADSGDASLIAEVMSGKKTISAAAKEVRARTTPAPTVTKAKPAGPDLKQLQRAANKFDKAATALDQAERELSDLLDHPDWREVDPSDIEDALDDVCRNARASELLRRLIDQLLADQDEDEDDSAA